MPWYTVMTLLAMALVVALELVVIRSGIFRMRAFWIALGICALFQIPVDGWLTKLSSTIVIYNPDVFAGVRIFFDSPIEDWGFGFALMTLVLALWVRQGRNDDATSPVVRDAALATGGGNERD